MIQFPVWIIPFPLCKTGFGLLSKNGKYLLNSFLNGGLEMREIIPFLVWMIPFPVCKT